MTEPQYRIIFGLSLLASIYFEWSYIIYLLIGCLVFEGLTNRFIPERVQSLTNTEHRQPARCHEAPNKDYRFNIQADRVTRFAVAFLIAISYIGFPQWLWFLSWFVGFNIVLAGICNCCPTTLLLQKAGFR